MHKVNVEIKHAGYNWLYEVTDHGKKVGARVSGFKLSDMEYVNLLGDAACLGSLFGNIAVFMCIKQRELLLSRNS